MSQGHPPLPIRKLLGAAQAVVRANLETTRSDPENRPFKHPDPLYWTECHRADILEAMYIILLGNPTLDLARNADMLTRFKPWYRLVGSAVEHAAAAASTLRPTPAAPTARPAKLAGPPEGFFAREFAKMDTADEGDSMLGKVLVELDEWAPQLPGNHGKPNGKATFTAAELAQITHTLSTRWDTLIEALRLLLYPSAKPDLIINSLSLGRRLD